MVSTVLPLVAGAAIGIRDRPIVGGSPWQTGFAEQPIGSIRRECLDHVIVVGEARLAESCKSTPAITMRSEGPPLPDRIN